MKKEWLLLLASSLATVVVALGAVSWLAPHLLGLPTDLELVQVDERIPPFFDGVFRDGDLATGEFILKDPVTRVRARPLFPENEVMGPHDLLGFRNRRVPNVADIVVLGDSQTYGNNVPLEQNWPHQMQAQLAHKRASVYSMAVGGWGAVQYLDMFAKAVRLQPRVVVVAFYSGNDPLDSFTMAYGAPRWHSLIPDPGLDAGDAPRVELAGPGGRSWSLTFDDQVTTVFTPGYRLPSNDDLPAVRAGYAVMAETAARMNELAQSAGVRPVFTIIPTKELVYARRVGAGPVTPPDSYRRLVRAEAANIDHLAGRLTDLDGATYVDVVGPLQEAALGPSALYPEDGNGHPVEAGYAVIGRVVAQAVAGYLPAVPAGLVAVMSDENRFRLMLLTPEGKWVFASPEIVEANGWPPGMVESVSERDVADRPYLGIITTVEPERFGPPGPRRAFD